MPSLLLVTPPLLLSLTAICLRFCLRLSLLAGPFAEMVRDQHLEERVEYLEDLEAGQGQGEV